MPNKGIATPWEDVLWVAGRAIILQVLRSDHEVRWTPADLRYEISDLQPEALGGALERLRREGVVVPRGKSVVASRCARHLDALGMVAV